MEQIFYNFVNTATTMQKGVFLMFAGILFVFSVQVIFFMIVKLWPKK